MSLSSHLPSKLEQHIIEPITIHYSLKIYAMRTACIRLLDIGIVPVDVRALIEKTVPLVVHVWQYVKLQVLLDVVDPKWLVPYT